MAHFYGAVSGQRGRASRLGSKSSGLSVTAASWQGAIEVSLYHDDKTNTDNALVMMVPWHGSGIRYELYDGPVNGATIAKRSASPRKGETA